MSKIGRKPINTEGVQIELRDHTVAFKGPKASGVYVLPEQLHAVKKENMLFLEPNIQQSFHKNRELKRIWGLHRALLSNKIAGARMPFSQEVSIVGLGFKAALAGRNLLLSLGYSHKIDFPLSQGVSVTIDKTGQKLLFESSDNVMLGEDVSRLKTQRPPEPYKGTGIKKSTEEIFRKAGKKKA
jgi:large subunit ribosomal protein L6